MAKTWIMVLLVASIHDAVSGVFSPPQNDQPKPFEGLFDKWPDAKSICRSKCSCSEDGSNLFVDCRSQGFDSLPQNLPLKVARLEFAGNNLHKLSFNSSRLDSLVSLNVSNNRISEISVEASRWIPNIRSLDLSRNLFRTGSAEPAFRDLKFLSHLDLSHNQLNSVTDPMFVHMNSLGYLNLSSCQIERVSYDGFRDLTSLGTLDLSRNNLDDLRHEWLRNLVSLQHLYLQSNSIRFLRNVVFSTLKNLQVLDLSQNNIKSVGLLSFKGLTNLQFLNISSNDVSHLQEGVFRSLEVVKTIDLSDNSARTMDNIFTHTKDLEQLHLRNCRKLGALTRSSLQGARNLKLLDLSGSVSLAEIHPEAFHDSKGLVSVDVSRANLSHLEMGVLDGLASIQSLQLSGNPWRCDCHLYWLLLWLGEHTQSHLLAPSETQCRTPDPLAGHALLDALDHSMVCTHAVIRNHTLRTRFKVGLPARLECNADGTPVPQLTWITPAKDTLVWDREGSVDPNETSEERFHLGPDGGLDISSVQRGDGGFYVCVASNPLGRTSASIRLTLDYSYISHIKVVSVLVGLATSFGFLLATLVSVLVRMVLRHLGVRGCCRGRGNASPRTQQIKKVLESMEHYKRQQLDRLRGNYNMQVQRIKDNCMQQMERLRESYSSQAECLRDFREYGTLQIDRIRENYYSQVQRVRDYSASQIVRLRENYLCQRNRIRKFSAHHLYKLRENYKVQQQHLNRILENLNIESCRNVCQRTESVTFDPPDIALGFPVPQLRDVDASSQGSAYFTPDEEAGGSDTDGGREEVTDLTPAWIVPRGRAKVRRENVEVHAARRKLPPLGIEDKSTSTSDIRCVEMSPLDTRSEEAPQVNLRREEAPQVNLRREEAPQYSLRSEEAPQYSLRNEEAPQYSLRREEAPQGSYRSEEAPRSSLRSEEASQGSYRSKEAPQEMFKTEEAPQRRFRSIEASQVNLSSEEAPQGSLKSEEAPPSSLRMEKAPQGSLKCKGVPQGTLDKTGGASADTFLDLDGNFSNETVV